VECANRNAHTVGALRTCQGRTGVRVGGAQPGRAQRTPTVRPPGDAIMEAVAYNKNE